MIDSAHAIAEVAAEPVSVGRRGGVVVHAVVLVIALAVVILITPRDEPWSVDDGAYVVATRLVRDEGRWSEVRPELGLADTPQRYPLGLSDVANDGRAYPYVKHPAWVMVLVTSTNAFGDPLGFAVPVAGALLAAALAAWTLARRLGVVRPWAAFWLTGLGPIFVLATASWAHSAAAALGGLGVLLLLDLASRRDPPRAVALGVVLASIALIRTEGLFFALAVAAGLAWVRWRASAEAAPRGRRSAVVRLVDPVLAAVVVGLAALGERLWIGALTDGQSLTTSGPIVSSPGLLLGRADGAWRTFLAPSVEQPGAAMATAVAAALGGLALLLAARGHPGRRVAMATLGASTCLILRYTQVSGEVIPGIAAAWPAATAGLMAWTLMRRRAGPDERLVAGVAIAFAGMVAVTQYPNGGGLDWGGRFLSVLAVPAAILAVLGLERLARDRSVEGGTGRLMAGTAVVLTAGFAVAGLHSVHQYRVELRNTVATVRATDPDVAVAPPKFIPRYDLQVPRLAWERSSRRDLAAAVDAAFDRGARRVTVVGEAGHELSLPGVSRRAVDDQVTVFER